jgi:hypothetical protein
VSHRILARALVLAAVTAGASACLPPGVATLIEKGLVEARGGWGEAREVQGLPPGRVLDRFRSVKVARVERSADVGPLPKALPKVVETELGNALREAKLFPGDGGPTLVVRTRLTGHWPAAGFSPGSGHSEVVARVEFLEEGRGAPLGIYFVRGISGAIARNSDENLGRGLASGVVELIGSRRTPPETEKSVPEIR